jgi:hypothetical protein
MNGNYERSCPLQTKKILTPMSCLWRSQRREAFVASLSVDKNTFFHCAIGNLFQIREKCSLHDAKEKLQLELSGCCQLPSEFPLNEQGGAGKLQKVLTGWATGGFNLRALVGNFRMTPLKGTQE